MHVIRRFSDWEELSCPKTCKEKRSHWHWRFLNRKTVRICFYPGGLNA